ncbi:MAG: hypothetical protein HQ521_14115 [Bacteroidetes bacterium]|nr:hypothetical protein [Bacteroidota bacterium]
MITIISSLIIISSCSIRGYEPISNSETNKTLAPYVFGDEFKKAVYKTNINIYSNNLTGITLIKKIDSAYRVVSMSELGIKYMDIEFPFDRQKSAKVHYIMESLNRKMLVNMFIKDFSLLFYPPEISHSHIMVNENNPDNLLIENKNLVYIFNSEGTISNIKKKRISGGTRPIVSFSYAKQASPNTISVIHGKIDYEFAIID